ncbi:MULTISPECIES: hypothetical protein [unclassified Bacillus (in: firmicutes)]|uniref:hypothetical protein n=1 Tax=unclassified Bacillus (in: firmicutes) TaxID=185979 RepID=UPI001BED0893|nr:MULTISPECIES: hypothetical protein [unclassified Bacillus (in: firmicutes)]MBT2617448.1 hypothetical protein [Bacillus sp. ISL-78]MBT2630860.1 hypothetical protein [Bacillus sp. ISL-101]
MKKKLFLLMFALTVGEVVPQSRQQHRKKFAMKMYLTLVEKELTKGEYVER